MRTIVSFLLLLSFVSFSMPNSKLKVGTPVSILEGIINQNTKVTSMFTLLSSTAEKLHLDVKDFYFTEGYLSMSGMVQGSENSSFMFKGNEKRIYGWIVLKDKNVAYEYTTNDAGKVIVELVPVSRVITICDMHPPEGSCDNSAEVYKDPSAKSPEWVRNVAPHIGDYDGTTSLHNLESLPGSGKVMYMDISRIMNGETPLTLSSKEEIWKTWQSVASSLSMFDINVTTNRDAYDAVSTPNKGIATFLNQSGRSNADVNSFGGSGTSRNYKGSGQGYGLGRTAHHEIGHQMGLYHDKGNNGSQEYFPGISAFKWCPIMGNYWAGNSWGNEALYQWSIGEYTGASQFQDDLNIIGSRNDIDYREDDIPTSVLLTINGSTVAPENNFGQIAQNTDSDEFTFSVGNSGHVTLTVSRIEYLGGGMLDVAIELKNESGSVVAEDNPKAVRSASIDLDLDEGDYTLIVQGGDEGTPSNGFSNYSSLGFYAIEGTVEGGVTNVIDKNLTNTNKAIGAYLAASGNTLNLDIPSHVQIKNITLYATNGSVVYSSKTKVSAIDISHMAGGLYILSVAFDGTTMVKKIVTK